MKKYILSFALLFAAGLVSNSVNAMEDTKTEVRSEKDKKERKKRQRKRGKKAKACEAKSGGQGCCAKKAESKDS
jgi:hypothetical protein